MQRYVLFFCFVLCSLTGIAQDEPAQNPNDTTLVQWSFLKTLAVVDSLKNNIPKQYWEEKNKFGLNINQVAFENWSAGGSNSISALFNSEFRRTYERKNIRWKSELLTRYGLNVQKGQKIRKTDDHLELNSTFGYRADTLTNWFYSAKLNFSSQFANGYNYPNREKSISGFMAPGYLLAGVGAEFGKNSDVWTIYVSPITYKSTFVLNQRLANQGSFGVKPAVKDDEGNVLEKGEKIKSEFGVLITNEYNTQIFENIGFTNRLSLYSDYLNDFGNVDVDWEINFNFRVNQYVLAKLGSHLKYDNDIKVNDKNEIGEYIDGGAKVQWKQQLGIGVIVEI